MATFDNAHFSPIGSRRLETKEDLQDAFKATFEPLLPAFSSGAARVRVEQGGAHFDDAAADLEGFARPLWGIVPFVAGGGKFEHWDLYHRGLTNGTDPDHPEYWGTVGDRDQRQVELAAIGFAMALIPEQFWEPLSEKAKENMIQYLRHGRDKDYPICNWRFFRVLVDLGLKKVGAQYDVKMTEEYLDDVDSYYLGEGYYGDGFEKYKMDYYNPWAFHFYGLIYAKVCPEDSERQKRYKERTRVFAEQFQHWFADDGSCIPFGRSLVYRFACGSYWAALAFADEEALPWGVIKGLYMRHMRWWTKQPISRLNSGVLSLGYAYPNSFVCENYNSPQSPYWAMKAFLPLALPSTHPFWTAQELPASSAPANLPIPGMVISHYPQNTVALMSGPQHFRDTVRFQAEKYCKFAYSTRYGFSIDANAKNFNSASFDSMIGFSEDGIHFRIRESTKARIHEDRLYSTWSPWEDVSIETWLIPQGKWHIRVHRIESGRRLDSMEGGFAISKTDAAGNITKLEMPDRSYAANAEDFSGMVNLSANRKARIHVPESNSNLMAQKTILPQLLGEIAAGSTTLFGCAVLAMPDTQIVNSDWKAVPELPSEEELEAIKKLSKPVFGE
ncbi:hypothetical protein K450DRAFT_263779 [Umbelopsis ramanniana AG]|uniref:DUF2264 domain-containing protein n=1 Tax=Umbelopsis ramanniana AG TaxID=1314678 RepID=A0AAD5H9J7_UMBRA|nr:uncharacterized protein K450DRAFT_263779 [Umbelopsis ramanniana AG]KAI8575009.1 hypothetical protein K450DRAFT_263779 [Umbelopsis ramanniana AG]